MKSIVIEYIPSFSRVVSLLAGAALLASGVAVNAQLLEEVVVTAQKREQNLQDVPISVTAFSGEQLTALGVTDFSEISQQVPALQLNTWSPKLTNFNLRGVSQNTFNDNNEGPIAVYFDDVYSGSLNGISGNMFDMERVEVLRGPQGTLFGRNATGGLIHYVSRDASDAEDNGYVQLEGGEYDRYNAEFGVGGSISDSTRYRFSGRWATMDGYIKSVDTTAPGGGPVIFTGSGQDIGGVDGYSLRGTIQTDFNDQLQGNFWLKYSRDEDVATGGYVFENCPLDADGACAIDEFGRTVALGGVIDLFGETADEFEHYGEHPGTMNREQWSGTARFDYDMNNGMEFVSITNLMTNDYNYDEDGDALGLPILTFQTFVDYSQWSQEFRLAGETDRSRWQAGVYYLDMQWDGGTSVTGAPGFGQVVCSGRLAARGGNGRACGPLGTANPFNGFDGAISAQDYVLNSKNWSVFGQADFDVADNMVLTAGLRYTQDTKDMTWRLFFSDINNPVPVTIESAGLGNSFDLATVSPGVDEIDYSDWAGRIALNWTTSDSTIVFASINRGIKGGNWSIGGTPNITADTFQHEPEQLTSYEIGFKTEWDTGRLNGTAFYYDYKDYQAFSLAGGGPFISNSDATIQGGELELFLYPNERFDTIFGLAYNDSNIDEILGAAAIIGGGGAGGAIIPDAEMPNAPTYSFNYLFRYNWDVGAANVAAQVDGVYYDDQFLEVTNGSGSFQESYNVSNARLTYYGADDRYSFSLWVKNFTDETYKQYALDLGALGTTSYYAPPRMWGGTVRVEW